MTVCVKCCIKNVLVTTPRVYLSPSFPFQNMYAPDDISSVYGRRGTKLSPTLAAFVNGVAVSINSWNRWVTIVPSTPDNFGCTKPITTTKLRLFCTQLWHRLGSQQQEGLMKTLNGPHITLLQKFPTLCLQTLLKKASGCQACISLQWLRLITAIKGIFQFTEKGDGCKELICSSLHPSPFSVN